VTFLTWFCHCFAMLVGNLFFSLALCFGGAKWASQPCRASTAVRCRRLASTKTPLHGPFLGALAKIVHTQLKISNSPLTDDIFWRWVRSHPKSGILLTCRAFWNAFWQAAINDHSSVLTWSVEWPFALNLRTMTWDCQKRFSRILLWAECSLTLEAKWGKTWKDTQRRNF